MSDEILAESQLRSVYSQHFKTIAERVTDPEIKFAILGIAGALERAFDRQANTAYATVANIEYGVEGQLRELGDRMKRFETRLDLTELYQERAATERAELKRALDEMLTLVREYSNGGGSAGD